MSLLVGAGMVVLGVLMVLGRNIRFHLPGLAFRTAPAGTEPARRIRDAFVFGIAYAIASLSCSFGLLIALIGQAVAMANVAGLLAVFGAFALGATTLLLGLTVLAAAAGGVLSAVLQRYRRFLAALPRVSGVILLLAGVYLVLYWLPATTGIGADNGFFLTVSLFAAAVSEWIALHQVLVISFTILVTIAALTIVLVSRRTARSQQERVKS